MSGGGRGNEKSWTEGSDGKEDAIIKGYVCFGESTGRGKSRDLTDGGWAGTFWQRAAGAERFLRRNVIVCERV